MLFWSDCNKFDQLFVVMEPLTIGQRYRTLFVQNTTHLGVFTEGYNKKCPTDAAQFLGCICLIFHHLLGKYLVKRAK